MSSDQISMIIGILVVILGCVYAHKAWMAGVQGKIWYWQGFLPFTLVSPWIVIFPPKENSLCKVKEAMWIHLVMGPAFLISALVMISSGLDLTGLPGTEYVNSFFTMGTPDKTPIIVFDKKRYSLRFPAVVKTGQKAAKMFFDLNMKLKGEDDLLPADHKSIPH